MNNVNPDIPANDRGVPSPKQEKKPLFHFWRCFWLTFLVVSLAYAWHSFYVPPNDIVWAEDYVSAQRQADLSGKPIILYFTATWCVPCRVMKRQVWADPQVMALVNEEFVPVTIDVGVPENADVMARYKVEGSPVTIVCDSHGAVMDWRAGGLSKSQFLEFLDSPSLSREKSRSL